MKTILELIKRAGGWHPGLYLEVANKPFPSLVIEATDESGPCALPAVSVAHYGERNGDLMRDPEMCFELGMAGGPHLNPFLCRNDYVGMEQWSRFIKDGNYCYHAQLHEQQENFAKLWDNNLRLQGFLEASNENCIHGQFALNKPESSIPSRAANLPPFLFKPKTRQGGTRAVFPLASLIRSTPAFRSPAPRPESSSSSGACPLVIR